VPDLYRPDPVRPEGTTLLDMLEVKPDTFKPEDVGALQEMAKQAAPEHEKRNAAYTGAQDYERQLARSLSELGATHAEAANEAQRMLVESCDEAIAMTSSCDVKGLAARLRPVQDQVQLLTDARDLLRYKRFPAARIQTLEAALKLRQIEELLASIAASVSYASTLSKLITAGIFQNENRVAIISEETESLRALAKESARQVVMAKDELRAERQRQATAEQQRIATHQVTRAEVAAAIPSYSA
jgi:hypothetical protein